MCDVHAMQQAGACDMMQVRQHQEKVARRQDKVQRIVKACQEVAAAAQLQQVCCGVQSQVPDVEQSCIMVQWMLQEVADLGISGATWSPAKASWKHSLPARQMRAD